MFSVIENSVNLDAVNLDALYLVKPIFGKYFCYSTQIASLFHCNCNCTLTQIAFQCARELATVNYSDLLGRCVIGWCKHIGHHLC